MLRFIFFVFLFFVFSCRQNQTPEEVDKKISDAYAKVEEANKNLEIAQKELDILLDSKNGNETGDSKDLKVPQKVYDTYEYVKKFHHARSGFVGGREFKNLEQLLPKVDKNGNKIQYQEWDVNPKKSGKNRGRQRLVTGSDGSAYYTNDHYQSFSKIE